MLRPECIFKIKKHIASHELTEDQARTLMTDKRVGPIETFKNRFGQPFTADLTLDKKKKTWKIEFIFEGDDLREEELKSLDDEKSFAKHHSATVQKQKSKYTKLKKHFWLRILPKKLTSAAFELAKPFFKKRFQRNKESNCSPKAKPT